MEEAFSILVVAEWKSVLEAQQPEITEELGTLQRLLARSHTTREGQVAQKRQRGGASGAGPLFQGAGEAVASSPGGGRWPAGGRLSRGWGEQTTTPSCGWKARRGCKVAHVECRKWAPPPELLFWKSSHEPVGSQQGPLLHPGGKGSGLRASLLGPWIPTDRGQADGFPAAPRGRERGQEDDT